MGMGEAEGVLSRDYQRLIEQRAEKGSLVSKIRNMSEQLLQEYGVERWGKGVQLAKMILVEGVLKYSLFNAGELLEQREEPNELCRGLVIARLGSLRSGKNNDVIIFSDTFHDEYGDPFGLRFSGDGQAFIGNRLNRAFVEQVQACHAIVTEVHGILLGGGEAG